MSKDNDHITSILPMLRNSKNLLPPLNSLINLWKYFINQNTPIIS